jgi:hypothetical protein
MVRSLSGIHLPDLSSINMATDTCRFPPLDGKKDGPRRMRFRAWFLLTFLWTAPLLAQNECGILQNLPPLNAVDSIGIVHKNVCWDPIAKVLSFPLAPGASLGSNNTFTGSNTFTQPITSTVATGTAPLNISSTTLVLNLNAALLSGGSWPQPGTIGSTTPNTGAFTTLASTQLSVGRVASYCQNITPAFCASALYIDALAYKNSSNCTVGTNDDACIQAAIATVPSGGTAIIDISGMGNLTFAGNLFAPLQPVGQPQFPSKVVVIRANAGQTITVNAPQLVPAESRVENYPIRGATNGYATVWTPGPSFPPCWAIHAPCNTSVETTTATNSAPNCAQQTCLFSVTPSSGTPFTSSMLYSHFGVCVGTAGSWGTACVGAAAPNNGCGTNGEGAGSGPCFAFGVIVGVNINSALPTGCGSANCLLVAGPQSGGGFPVQANALGVNYVIFAPTVTLGDFNTSSFNGGVQWLGGIVQTGSTQNVGTGGASPIACANFNAQEESYFQYEQCQLGGTGTGSAQQLEMTDFNSGPYDNNILTATGNCNAASILLINRGNLASAFTRPYINTTLTGTGCNSGAGISNLVDWETAATLGPGIHIENGSGSNVDIDVGDGATLVCPVFCATPPQTGQDTDINDVNQTVGGAATALVRFASTAINKQVYTVRKLRANTGNLLVDLNTGCTVAQANEPSLGFYITAATNGSSPSIMYSSSTTPGCQTQAMLPPAYVTTAYSNATASATSVLGMKMNVAPSSLLKMTCYVTYSMTGTTPTGPTWSFTGPAAPTLTTLSLIPGEGGAPPTPISAASFGSIVNNGSLVSGQLYTDVVSIMVANGTTGGTVQLQGKPPSTSFTLAVAANSSYCQ